MQPSDLFSVGARLIGLYVIYRGSEYLLLFLMNAIWSTSDTEAARYNQQGAFLMAAWYFAIGFALLFGAEWVTRVVFGERTPSDSE